MLKTKSALSYFGSDSEVASDLASLLDHCKHVTIPFVGGAAILPHLKARAIVANDMNEQAINFYRVASGWYGEPIQSLLVKMCQQTLSHPTELEWAQSFLNGNAMPFQKAWAYWAACWIGRKGKGGTKHLGGMPSIRRTAVGGNNATRIRAAADDLTEWARHFERCEWESVCFRELLPKVADRDDCGIYCVPAGALVRMYDESVKPIETVQVGEIVSPGNTVLAHMSRPFCGDLICIEATGGRKLRTTGEHRVLCTKHVKDSEGRDRRSAKQILDSRQYVQAENIEVGDWVFGFAAGENRAVDLNSLWDSIRTSQPWNEDKLSVNDCDGLWTYLGLYAAEGHVSKKTQRSGECSSVVFSFGIDEVNTLAQDCSFSIQQAFGKIPVVAPNKPHATVCSVRLHSRRAAEFTSNAVVGTATTKRLAEWVMRLTPDKQKLILRGWILGDGNIQSLERGRSKAVGTTSSKTLAYQMFRIAERCGLSPSIWKIKKSGYHRVALQSRKDLESLGLIPVTDKVSRSSQKIVEDHIAVRVRRVSREAYDGQVFDLDVDGTDSFICDGLLIHNCDPPWVGAGRNYLHAFTEQDHIDLQSALKRFESTTVVVRYGDDPFVRKLYDGWLIIDASSRDQCNAVKGEVWIINKPTTQQEKGCRHEQD